MSIPTNPLDAFVSYTYHFELHASPDWEVLKEVGNSDLNASTTRKDPEGTLLINTRKDAHQHLDNVKFFTQNSLSDPNANLGVTSLVTLEIDEPGGMLFAEKLKNLRAIHKVSSLSTGIHFGLKIFFVGRYSNNKIDTISMPGIIPLQLNHSEGVFTHQGGKYLFSFNHSVGFLNASASQGDALASLTVMNRSITISSLTCQEALKELENKFNDHYKMIFEKEVDTGGKGRKVVYKINVDPRIKGELQVANADDYAAGTKMQLGFDANVDISAMVRKILNNTDEVTKLIAESKDGIKKEFHPNVKLPKINVNYVLTKDSAEVIVDIGLYEGSDKDKYEFDFYFSEPGKNVDVLGIDVKFSHLNNWMNMSTTQSTALLVNNNSKLAIEYPDVFKEEVIIVDKYKHGLKRQLIERQKVDLESNEVAIPGTTTNDKFGMISVKYKQIPNTRLAFSTLAEAHGSTENQLNVSIRGHLSLLRDSNAFPDGGLKSFGNTWGIWVKVNINNMVDGEPEPFYYTGWYQLMGVENIFSGGKFLQNLTLQMLDSQQNET